MSDQKEINPFSFFSEKEEEKNGHAFPGLDEEHLEQQEPEQVFHLSDEIDHEIFMHRDAHFGGDFKVMLNYYQQENSNGVNPSFDFERIAYLAEVEKQFGQDLASFILTQPEAEKVARAREVYEHYKAIYSVEEEKNLFPRLIANLVLTEEELPAKEISAITAEGSPIVDDLLNIIRAEETYDPLFPGYGLSPYFAMMCLGKIGNPKAIIPLFEALEKEVIFEELIILETLSEIGEEAKAFLLQVLKSRPITKDNVNAAFALTIFSDDPTVSIASFEQLQETEVREKPLFRTYLLYNCEKLQTTSYRDAFIQMGQDPNTPLEIATEIRNIVRDWH